MVGMQIKIPIRSYQNVSLSTFNKHSLGFINILLDSRFFIKLILTVIASLIVASVEEWVLGIPTSPFLSLDQFLSSSTIPANYSLASVLTAHIWDTMTLL